MAEAGLFSWLGGELWKLALEGVISGFEGLNPHSLALAWTRLTRDRPHHNKRGCSVKAEGQEIKTQPENDEAAAGYLGFQ